MTNMRLFLTLWAAFVSLALAAILADVLLARLAMPVWGHLCISLLVVCAVVVLSAIFKLALDD